MHTSSLSNMKHFAEKYLSADEPLRILDVGSQVVEGESDGSYRTIFDQDNWRYEGADIVPGENVDIVIKNPYLWKELKSKAYDCVVCGQMFEHDEFFWLTMLEIRRVLKPGGLCCIVAPSGGMEHQYPVDCYRFYPDGLKAAAKYAGLDVIEAYAQWNSDQYPDMDDMWRDCVLVCQRQKNRFTKELFLSASRWLIQTGSYSACQVHYSNHYPGKTTWTFPKPPISCTLYYDEGKGFNEQNTIRLDITSGSNFSKIVEIPDGIKALRFDPVEGFRCVVQDLCIVSNGERLQYKCENGIQTAEGFVIFWDTLDPRFLIENAGGLAGEVEISGTICVIA